MNFIILNRLNICNVGNNLFFRNRVREAVIIITLSYIYRSMIKDWKVSYACSFSDHQLISFSINLYIGFHLGIQEEPTGSNLRRLWRGNLGVITL